ncbi:rhodanese-like domain-containing protein [Sideroxydans lithotrophicus]|uniref:Rhodanese domain protein n=1 Tax=Sideroxydans lithotrophicus (strain ES-1) TaxID=580332 RepID=D5CU51_SIDLE|nr:rhodanese-like domain-containing protein [Sideroxydans lithotrophicus]ADE10386.1 Rhodanese domain protein [Sideroxydans lithotrophicus ES-1]
MKLKKIFWTLAIIVGAALVVQQLQAADGIDAKQALSMEKQGALLLDVREPEEYKAVHAPNAKLIPLGQLGSRLPEIAAYKDKPIVVMCRSGRRSAMAVSQLRDAGYTQVSNVKGGIQAWEHDGLEVVKM